MKSVSAMFFLRTATLRPQQGFTLIELISVIVILGILATTSIGLFSRKESFEARVVANQLIASLHLGQQLALSRENQPAGVPVSVVINQSTDDWSLGVWDLDPSAAGNAAFDTASVERSDTTLRVSTTDFTTDCASLSASNAFTISYDSDGNLSGVARARLCVVGDQTIQICITSLGYAYEGGTCL